MNCEHFQSEAALYIYGELDDAARHIFETHAAQCDPCGKELAELRAMKAVLAGAPYEEPSPSMLASARMKLQEAIETTPQERGWTRFFTVDLAGWMHQVRFSPALASVLLMAGFAGGALTSYRMAATHTGGGNPVAAPVANVQQAAIGAISGITQDPANPKMVHIDYERMTPETAQGSVDDPKIQELLMYAAQSNRSAGVRLDSINLLTEKPEDAHVREMLVYALRYDKNMGVRLKALDGLRNYVATDTRVRDAVLDALLNDTNTGVRAEAIGMLRPVKADTSVRETLALLARQDKDNYIRTESKRILASTPELE